jgi:hypothetical protein
MEHRCGARRNLELTVLVRRRGWGGSVVARLADISISGAFVEGPPEAFPLHSRGGESRPRGGGRHGLPALADQADLAAGAAALAAPEAGTSGTGSSTQLPDSRRAGHGIA